MAFKYSVQATALLCTASLRWLAVKLVPLSAPFAVLSSLGMDGGLRVKLGGALLSGAEAITEPGPVELVQSVIMIAIFVGEAWVSDVRTVLMLTHVGLV